MDGTIWLMGTLQWSNQTVTNWSHLKKIPQGAGPMAEWLSSRALLRRPRVRILGVDMALLVRPR